MKNTKSHITPPRLAEKLLTWFIKDELAEEVLGDLDEKFYATLKQHSISKAKRNYWFQVINYLRPFAFKFFKNKNSFNNNAMIKHYFKTSWRGLIRDKVFSFIKIGGFAVGIAACILISLFVNQESSYDKQYKDGDRIFRIANNYQSNQYSELWTNLQGPLKPVLEDNLPEIEQVSKVVLWKWGNVGENNLRKVESPVTHFEDGFFYSDPELLEILEIPMLYGNQKTALATPMSLVMSKQKADKHFPNQNPVGKQIILNDDNETTYTITGVFEDFPSNSHLQGDFIMTLVGRTSGPGSSGWCCTNYDFYVKLKSGTSKISVEQKMVAIRDTYVMDKLEEAGKTDLEDLQQNQTYYLQPVSNIHLNPERVGDNVSHGSIETLWIFSIIAGIILIIATLNFINLSTAKSIKKAKEVGLRKVVGSVRSSLIQQFLLESIFFCFLAVVLSTIVAWISLPFFNQLAEKSLVIPWTTIWFIPTLFTGSIIIGILSGLYPAFYLSKFSPIQALRGSVKGTKSSMLRNGMVVFQFTATVILIIGALVAHQQFNHYMNQSLGYDKDQVVNILGMNSFSEEERDVVKSEVLRLASVESASYGDYLPVAGGSITNFAFWIADRRQVDSGFEAARWIVDEDYIQTMSMEIASGRNFENNTSDDNAILINESMAKQFGLENPIGTQIIDMFDDKYTIIGVVKDFYFESLTGDVIRPLAMVKGKGKSTLSLKIKPENMQTAMAGVTSFWEDFQPNQPIRYTFMDQRFQQMYSELVRVKTIFFIFSTLSIIVACLGLFALSAYTIEQRSKEICVRKVLGASVPRLFSLLASDFIKLVVIAIIIAIPTSWYLINDLLSNIGNRIELNWPVFAVASFSALTIALATISFESFKAAFVNPASKLRSE